MLELMVEQTRQLLLDVIPLIEGAKALLRIDDDHWIVVFTDETAVGVRADRQLGKLELSTPVGTPTAELRNSTWHTAMVFNGQQERTNGQRFSINGPNGELHLLVDLGIQGLEINRLTEIISAFADRGRTWAKLFALNGGLAAKDSTSEAHAEGVGIGKFV